MASETEEIRGVGHSVKRVEDDRFIRGAGNYIDDIHLPGMLHMAILRSPYAHATINGHRRLEGAGAAGRDRRRDRRADGAAQPRVDAHALRRHAGGPGDRQGAVPGAGGGGGHRDRPVHRGRRARADRRRLRPARRRHDAAAGAGGRRPADPHRQGRPGEQPRLLVGDREQGGDRPRVLAGRRRRLAGHVLPADPPGAARDVRVHRGHQPRDRSGRRST